MPAQEKELKLISARAIKRQITNNGIQGISAQTVQAVNAMADELLHKIALESYRIDTVLHLSQNTIRNEIKAILTPELAEAVTEALKVMEHEATTHLKKQQWEMLIFQDMASERLSTRPGGLDSPNSPLRRFLIPYHRVYMKLDSYCERREDKLSESADFESERATIRFRDDPHFSPTSVVFVTCALEYVVAAALKCMCQFVQVQQKDVIKMEDMLTALQEDATLSNMFSTLTTSNRLKRKISTHRQESAEIKQEDVPQVPTTMDNAIKLESLLDQITPVPDLPTRPAKRYQVREEPSFKEQKAKADMVKAGQITLNDASDEVHTRNTLLDFLSKGNGQGILTQDTKVRSKSFVDLLDFSSPEAHRDRQSAAQLFLKANPASSKKSMQVSELEQQKLEAIQEQKFRTALVEFLVKGDGSKKATAILKKNLELEKSINNLAQAKSENDVKKTTVVKMVSRSAVTSSPDIEFDSDEEAVVQKPKQTLADFLKEEPVFVPSPPVKKMMPKIESRKDMKKLYTDSDDEEPSKKNQQESLADFLRQTGPPISGSNPVITISQHDVAAGVIKAVTDEPKSAVRSRMKPKIESRRKKAVEDSDSDDGKAKGQSLADFLNESGPADYSAKTAPRPVKAPVVLPKQSVTMPRLKMQAKAERSVKKQQDDDDSDIKPKKKNDNADLMAFLADGPPEPVPIKNKGRRTSAGALGGFIKSFKPQPKLETVESPKVARKIVTPAVPVQSVEESQLKRAYSKSTTQLDSMRPDSGSQTLFRQKPVRQSQKQLPPSPTENAESQEVVELQPDQSVDSNLKNLMAVTSNISRESTSNSIASHASHSEEIEALKAKVAAQEEELVYTKGKLAKIQSMFDELSERAFKQIQDLIDERDMLKNVFQMWSDQEIAKMAQYDQQSGQFTGQVSGQASGPQSGQLSGQQSGQGSDAQVTEVIKGEETLRIPGIEKSAEVAQE